MHSGFATGVATVDEPRRLKRPPFDVRHSDDGLEEGGSLDAARPGWGPSESEWPARAVSGIGYMPFRPSAAATRKKGERKRGDAEGRNKEREKLPGSQMHLTMPPAPRPLGPFSPRAASRQSQDGDTASTGLLS
ncbi:hypothetical protein CDD83_2809 [Cordyceps sp. RAO-2017]|nr:hypothetical protein CDD83_2809 [Cordyceps sp. RAO-2017]